MALDIRRIEIDAQFFVPVASNSQEMVWIITGSSSAPLVTMADQAGPYQTQFWASGVQFDSLPDQPMGINLRFLKVPGHFWSGKLWVNILQDGAMPEPWLVVKPNV